MAYVVIIMLIISRPRRWTHGHSTFLSLLPATLHNPPHPTMTTTRSRSTLSNTYADPTDASNGIRRPQPRV
ncbi:hypothetical protein HYDPIDRAFT_111589 [Hydnomerulius pinastri MD-312]|uniref:Uncharacterized protein n=1 Tax=Hydnomerulius pinastri MD-312 TaxID=994086 RepID=A0A0C9WAD7_9AGAM|nr:hypothetical protein HYDPIDRAFT_111589 [Hydnomerulius pinastri MD-312]